MASLISLKARDGEMFKGAWRAALKENGARTQCVGASPFSAPMAHQPRSTSDQGYYERLSSRLAERLIESRRARRRLVKKRSAAPSKV